MNPIGAVILAAGASSRLGRPKQLLSHQGETLIRRAACAALGAGCLPTVIVTGKEREQIATELTGLEVQMRYHSHWERGIGSSIRAGVQGALALQPALDALLIMVCDQPLVSADLLVALIFVRAKARTQAAACAYAGTIGVPALFGRALFPALAALPDEQGAKAILSSMAGEIARVEFPAGAIDIDTPADSRAHLDGSPLLSSKT
jgi:molybdenum cofactor cytidylyltransferase